MKYHWILGHTLLVYGLICSPAALGDEKAAGLTGYGYAVAFHQGENATGQTKLFLTTFDGSSGFPLHELIGNSPFFSRELRPKGGTANQYEADYVLLRKSDNALLDHGSLNFTMQMGDSDANLFPDVLQVENNGDLSFSGQSVSDFNASQVRTTTGVLNRNAGSARGTYQLNLNQVTYTGSFRLVHWNGTVFYDRGNTNRLRFDVAFAKPNGITNQFNGTTTFQKVTSNQIVSDEAVLSDATGQSLTLKPMTFNRKGNSYLGVLELEDGEPVTGWRDYFFHILEIVDPNDSDGDGIPDLSDDFIPPPVILEPPLSQAVNQGASVTLNVSASSETPIQYQWQFNGDDLPGSTDSSLTIHNFRSSLVGDYRVIVRNSGGSVASPPATLTLRVPPAILEQPEALTVTQGDPAAFLVEATGTPPLAYQWLFNGNPIFGATNSTYTIANTQGIHAGDYAVTVSNPAGGVNSAPARLTLLFPPVITQSPQSGVFEQGTDVVLTVTAQGTQPLDYQWRFNGTPIGSPKGRILEILNAQPQDSGTYDVIVTNMVGTATSEPAAVTIGSAPVIDQQPQDITVTEGSQAVFEVQAQGTGPLSYQWRHNGTPLPGATQRLLALTKVKAADAGQYQVLVSNAAGSVASATATLNVLVEPVILTHPRSQFAKEGDPVTFTVEATGTAPLSYQWHLNGVPLPGATDPSYMISEVNTGHEGSYSVVVSNEAGQVESNLAQLTLRLPPEIIEQSGDLKVSPGERVEFHVNATGTAPLNYQWYRNDSPITGATQALLEIEEAEIADSGLYYVVVSNAAGEVTSENISLIVADAPVITRQPEDRTVFTGETVTFSVLVEGTPPIRYQWRVDGTDLDGATQPELTVSNLTLADAGEYAVTVSNAAGAVISEPALLTVKQKLLQADIQASGKVELRLTGQPGSDYLVEFSLNLGLWQELERLNEVGELEIIIDDQADGKARFYRARQAQ